MKAEEQKIEEQRAKALISLKENTIYELDRFTGKFAFFYKALAGLLCLFMTSSLNRHVMRYFVRFGHNPWKPVKKNENYTDFTYYFSMVACLKDEAEYIVEWIEYYLLMGVEHFYLYDNNSTDNIKEVLAPYVESGIVTLIEYPGVAKQVEMYNHALVNFRLKSKWFVVVDIDEFILPKTRATIKEFLKDNEKYGQILVSWVIFGDSGHKTKPHGLVTESFLHCANHGKRTKKTIVQGTKAYGFKIHRAIVKNTKTVALEEMQCNHYFGKSEEEYKAKKAKRRSASNNNVKYNMHKFERNNINDVYDPSMLAYAKKIHENLHKRRTNAADHNS